MAVTSKRVAGLASKLMKANLPRKQEKAVGGSALRQARRHKKRK